MEQDPSFIKNKIQSELESRYSFIPKEYVCDAVGEAYSEYMCAAPQEVQENEQKTVAWLRTVAKRRLLKLYPHPSISIDKEEFDVADDRENIEELFANQDSVKVALAYLSLVLRETIVLHYLQGMTHEEIRTRLEVNIETIKKRSQRGIEIMKEKMRNKKIM